ncbi:hypothetical protein [Mycolicibacterium neoaurum]|uniref:hypothetical protein n=1 Tax=Mycolicibacterium neoaurum TaxID=1795 RepID=UPI00114D4BC7|nr:hypothetical protein [Mycolicibacterium neoaurum]
MIEVDWRERAERAECRVQELEAEIEESTRVDLLARYRRVCVELDALKQAYARDTAKAVGGQQ